MSTDTLLNLALFAGAMLLMMRFGCGAHVMSHSHHTAARDPAAAATARAAKGARPRNTSTQSAA